MNIKFNHSTGYIPITNNSLTAITGLEEIAQNVQANVSVIKGEWFLDQTFGVDYFGIIFRKGVDTRFKELEIKKGIMTAKGVEKIERWTFDVDSSTRVATLSCIVVCKEGSFPYTTNITGA